MNWSRNVKKLEESLRCFLRGYCMSVVRSTLVDCELYLLSICNEPDFMKSSACFELAAAVLPELAFWLIATKAADQ